ncbi:hypothetical protein HK100_006739 [Physocladia obscura]|uniref:Elongator complex protein 5 n=1 Tax=Physocladia obscura TaxID=109957 RepID=A0AAD5XBJ2_9FUNG|nr:hypothetical protein HK100_006739 [Physocladia obscura]
MVSAIDKTKIVAVHHSNHGSALKSLPLIFKHISAESSEHSIAHLHIIDSLKLLDFLLLTRNSDDGRSNSPQSLTWLAVAIRSALPSVLLRLKSPELQQKQQTLVVHGIPALLALPCATIPSIVSAIDEIIALSVPETYLLKVKSNTFQNIILLDNTTISLESPVSKSSLFSFSDLVDSRASQVYNVCSPSKQIHSKGDEKETEINANDFDKGDFNLLSANGWTIVDVFLLKSDPTGSLGRIRKSSIKERLAIKALSTPVKAKPTISRPAREVLSEIKSQPDPTLKVTAITETTVTTENSVVNAMPLKFVPTSIDRNDPTSNLSFNLRLTDEQREMRDATILPYMHTGERIGTSQQTQGQSFIHYVADEMDDDEDEDDDLALIPASMSSNASSTTLRKPKKGSSDRLRLSSASNSHSSSAGNNNATINYSNNNSSNSSSSHNIASAQRRLHQPRHRSLPSTAISSTPTDIANNSIDTANSNNGSQSETHPSPLVSVNSPVQLKQSKSVSIKDTAVLKKKRSKNEKNISAATSILASDPKLRRLSEPSPLSATVIPSSTTPVKKVQKKYQDVDSGDISCSNQPQQQQQLSSSLTDRLYAGATFQNSPAPSDLPIPIFSGTKPTTPNIVAAPVSTESTSYSSPTPISSTLKSNYLGYHPEQAHSWESSQMGIFMNQSQSTGTDNNNTFIPVTLAAPQGFVPRQRHASTNSTNHSISGYPTTPSVASTPSLARLSMASIPPPPQHSTDDDGMFSMDSVRGSFEEVQNSREFAAPPKVEQGLFYAPPPPTAINSVNNGASNLFGLHAANFIPLSSAQFIHPSSVNYMQPFQHGAQIHASGHNQTVQHQCNPQQPSVVPVGKMPQQLFQQQQHQRKDHNMMRRSFGNNLMIPPSVITGNALAQNGSLKTVADNRDVTTPHLGAMSQNLKNLLKISH